MKTKSSSKAGARTHTPGPFEIRVIFGRTFVVARPLPGNEGGLQVAEVTPVKGKTNKNALLLAAAPELFSIVKDYAENADCGSGGEGDACKAGQCWHCQAVAMVAKVEGRAL